MEGHGEGGGSEEFRRAAEEARSSLFAQLDVEASRLDTELSELSRRMLESARRVAEDRVEREVQRLERASSGLSAELHRRLDEGAQQFRSS